jgi:hypothetical protein
MLQLILAFMAKEAGEQKKWEEGGKGNEVFIAAGTRK